MFRRIAHRGPAAALALAVALASAAPSPLLAAPAGETLSVGVASDPVTLDPAGMASFFELAVQYNLHEPLLHLTPDLKVEPGLASFEAPDPLTYRFTLKPNLTFQDGTPIDAAAAKANFDRVLDPATGSPRRSELGPVVAVEVTGPLTFTIRLKAPYAPLPSVLANRAGMLVSPAAVKALGPDFASRAVGAGPYRLVSWTKNAELVLERFPGYWRGPAPIERLVFRPMADETVRMTNLRAGTVGLVDAVPPQAVAQLRRDPALAVKERDGLGFNAFSFNTARAPFDDPRVRRAFAMAVDPATIQKAVYFGTGAPAYGPIPPSIAWAHDGSFVPPKPDPRGAKALLAEAGHTSPVAVTITVTNSPAQVRTAEILQAMANAAGFAVGVKQVDATSLISVLRGHDFDLCMSPWSGRPDPDGDTHNYLSRGGPNNFAGYNSDRTTELLEEARAEAVPERRAALYHQAEAQVRADDPMLFLTFPATIQASSASLDWQQYPDGALELQFAHLR